MIDYKKYEKYLMTKEVKNKDVSLYYMTNQKIATTGTFNTFGTTFIKNKHTLTNKYTKNIKKEILDKIIEISKNNETNLSLRNISDRILMANILQKSNYISYKGRLGPATHMIISPKILYKYLNIKQYLNNLNIIIEPHVKGDIIIYRKNYINQVGLTLLYMDDMYEIVENGNVDNFFASIKVDNYRKDKLKRILKLH